MRDICGTMTGYHKHYRMQEDQCDPCRNAMRQYWKNKRIERNTEINVLRKEWRERNKYLYKSNRTRARRLGVDYDYYTEQDVFDNWGYNCHLCGEAINFDAPRQCGKPGWETGLHIDHVVPLSKGGTDTLDNVRPAHGQCNIIKWASVDYLDKFRR